MKSGLLTALKLPSISVQNKALFLCQSYDSKVGHKRFLTLGQEFNHDGCMFLKNHKAMISITKLTLTLNFQGSLMALKI